MLRWRGTRMAKAKVTQTVPKNMSEIVNEINTRLADPAKVLARDDGSTGHKFGNETPLTNVNVPVARLLVLVEKKVNISLAMWANHSNTLDGWRRCKAHLACWAWSMRLSRY